MWKDRIDDLRWLNRHFIKGRSVLVGLSQDSKDGRPLLVSVLTIQIARTGGVLVHPIGISPLPILMARRSHCLRRLAVCKTASRSDCDWTQVSRFLYLIRQTSYGPPAAWALSLFLLTTEVMAGLSLGTDTQRIRVSFYSVFKCNEGFSLLRVNSARGCLPLIYQFKNQLSVKSVQTIF